LMRAARLRLSNWRARVVRRTIADNGLLTKVGGTPGICGRRIYPREYASRVLEGQGAGHPLTTHRPPTLALGRRPVSRSEAVSGLLLRGGYTTVSARRPRAFAASLRAPGPSCRPISKESPYSAPNGAYAGCGIWGSGPGAVSLGKENGLWVRHHPRFPLQLTLGTISRGSGFVWVEIPTDNRMGWL
jgi:hypothetical protein